MRGGVRLDRFRRALERVRVELTELHVHGFARRCVERVRAHIDDAMQGVDELLRGASSAMDARDLEQRRSAAWIEVEHALVALECAACAVRRAYQTRPKSMKMEMRSSSVSATLAPALEDVHEVAPVALRRVELAQGLERLGVLTAQVEHLLPELDGLLGIAEVLRRESGHLGVDVGLIGVARR